MLKYANRNGYVELHPANGVKVRLLLLGGVEMGNPWVEMYCGRLANIETVTHNPQP